MPSIFASLTPLLGALPDLAGLYVALLIIGGGLLLISAVFGGHGHDVGGDVPGDLHLDTDTGLDAGAHANAELSHPGDTYGSALAATRWLSIRFFIYFFAGFGGVGTVLTYTTELNRMIILASALAGGLAAGISVQMALRTLARRSGNSTPHMGDYIHKISRVTVPVQPPKFGEVAVMVRGIEHYIAAAAKHSNDRFKVGDKVVIASFSQGKAEIISPAEHEFVTQTAKEGQRV